MTRDDFYEAIELVDALIEDVKKLKEASVAINQNLADRVLLAKVELIEKYITGEIDPAKNGIDE